MNANDKRAVSTIAKKSSPKRPRKYGLSDPEMRIPEEICQYLPNDVKEAMAQLTTEKQYSLYLDIFKPLDFYELLFERCFKSQNETKSEDNWQSVLCKVKQTGWSENNLDICKRYSKPRLIFTTTVLHFSLR